MADDHRFSRRSLLRAGAVAGAGLAAAPSAAPAFVRRRPALVGGVQAGDVSGGAGVIWTQADRPSRMVVELAKTDSFRRTWELDGPRLRAGTAFTGRLRLRGLPPGERIFYRVSAADPHRPWVRSEPVVGSFTTAPQDPAADVSFAWSGDCAGQGWGINPDFGGYRTFAAIAATQPDFFLHSGDTVYADGPLKATVPLPDGSTWRNLVTPAKEKVAETLEEYRGQYEYNLLDANLKAFNAAVPQLNQWDDHEVANNWYPGEVLDDPRFTEKRTDVLVARARQAWSEFVPIGTIDRDGQGRVYRVHHHGPHLDVFVLDMRTYKDPNDGNLYADPERGLLGAEQREWLIRELCASRATWKLIANDLPLGLVVPDGPGAFEAVAQGDPGAPKGRELEFARVLRAAHRHGVRNLAFLTADVHYAAAHSYDPARAAIDGFDPFWEFVAGPLNAGAPAVPNVLDTTFGARTAFSQTAPAADNGGPASGAQFFGLVQIAGATGAMTVSLRDLDGSVRYSTTLTPA